MNSLLTLNRFPVLGFNTEYRLRAAFAQQPDEKKSFYDTRSAFRHKTTWNIISIVGCLPGVSLISAAYRAYLVYDKYFNDRSFAEDMEELVQSDSSVSQDEKDAAAAWLQDRKWFAIQEGALAVAEMCQLSIILAVAHLAKTLVDHIIAAYYQPEVESQVYNDFQEKVTSVYEEPSIT